MTSPSSRSKRRVPQKAQSRTTGSGFAVPTTTTGGTRRPAARIPERVDYSKDYSDVRGDLIRISILTVILLGGMVGVSFFV